VLRILLMVWHIDQSAWRVHTWHRAGLPLVEQRSVNLHRHFCHASLQLSQSSAMPSACTHINNIACILQ